MTWETNLYFPVEFTAIRRSLGTHERSEGLSAASLTVNVPLAGGQPSPTYWWY